MLGQSPHVAGPPAITAYLDFLALQRNVAPATQKQALNAMAFLIDSGTDIRTMQSLMGHAAVQATMIYLHVMKRPGAGGPSPLDLP